MLINNAGVAQGKLLVELKPEDIYQFVILHLFCAPEVDYTPRTFGVNTLAHFWTLKAFLPGMIKNKIGHIVSLVLHHNKTLKMSIFQVTVASVMSFLGSARMCKL